MNIMADVTSKCCRDARRSVITHERQAMLAQSRSAVLVILPRAISAMRR
jgi:hypothetical protein